MNTNTNNKIYNLVWKKNNVIINLNNFCKLFHSYINILILDLKAAAVAK